MRYTVVLQAESDGGFVVTVPALPGCVSEGDNRGGTLANIREAIELYIKDWREGGDTVPTEAGEEFVMPDADSLGVLAYRLWRTKSGLN